MEDGSLLVRPGLKMVRGFPLIRFFADNFEQVEQFQARPDDLLLATYTKSGTTWISEVVEMLKNDGDTEKCRRDNIMWRVPFLESAIPGAETGAELAARTPSPRALKTHLPIQLLPETFRENKCKIIYTARNAKDLAVSFFHFHRISKAHPEPGTWPEFLDKFLAGEVSYGSWFSHVKDWWGKAQQNPRILYLFYEDMLEDPRREIRKVADFIDKDLTPGLLEKTVHHTSFQQMKNNPMTNYDNMPPLLVDHTIGPFMRKGIAGDWKTHFTVAQNETFDAEYERQMSGSSLRFRTEI